MLPEFVDRTGGSKRVQAPPAGSGWQSAMPAWRWQLEPNIARRRIRELESMVPEFVDRTGGSKWLSALPTGSKWVQAQPAGSKWLLALPTGSRWAQAQPVK